MESIYRLGNIRVKLTGNESFFKFLHEEFKSNKEDDNDKFDIEFKLVKDLPKIKNYVSFSPILINENSYQCDLNGLSYQVFFEDGVHKVLIKASKMNLRKRFRPKWTNFNYLSPMELIAKNFMYDVFDYLSQLINLENNQSYLHASTIEKNGKGVAIIAWGGIGKTTSMLKLVLEDNWKFLSDDLGLIDENGYLYRSPKNLQVYAYNLEGQLKLKKMLLNRRSALDLFAWWLHLKVKGKKGVRRRISAEDLFGPEHVQKRTKLTDAFFIERYSGEKFLSEPISIEELAKRASNTIMSEMEPYNKISSAMYSSGYAPVLMRQEELIENSYQSLLKAFSEVNPTLIKIPLNAGPDELVNYLKKFL